MTNKRDPNNSSASPSSSIQWTIGQQLETKRHLDETARSFLRIELSIIGLIITIGSIAVFGQDPVFGSYATPERVEDLSININNSFGFLNDIQAQIIAEGIMVVFVVAVLLSVVHILLLAPFFQLRVIAPEAAGFSTSRNGIRYRLPKNGSNSSDESIKHYSQVIACNFSTLEEHREDLNKSFQALRNGVIYFIVSIVIAFPAIVLANALLALIASFLTIIIISFIISESVNISNVYLYIKIYTKIDACIFLTTSLLAAFLLIPPDFLTDLYVQIMVLVITLLIGITGISASFLEKHDLNIFLNRSIGLIFILMLATLFIGFMSLSTDLPVFIPRFLLFESIVMLLINSVTVSAVLLRELLIAIISITKNRITKSN
ncbi:hypothetical protein ACFQE8_10625 [Salinirubellus sp. GCM10025818]|uniref:hypothetical protein n=1 Tax=Salinirubellus TaxID=2162630 RepID=UPI0030D5A4D8